MFFSSNYAVYDESERGTIKATTLPDPNCPYGRIKLFYEHMMGDFNRTHGIRCMRLRNLNSVGADPDGETGEHLDLELHLIPPILDAAKSCRKDIAVFGTGYNSRDDSAVRDNINVSGLATAQVVGVEYRVRGRSSQSVNLGKGHGACSLLEVISVARQIAVRHADCHPDDPPTLVTNVTGATKVLGRQPQWPMLEPTIADAWAK